MLSNTAPLAARHGWVDANTSRWSWKGRRIHARNRQWPGLTSVQVSAVPSNPAGAVAAAMVYWMPATWAPGPSPA